MIKQQQLLLEKMEQWKKLLHLEDWNITCEWICEQYQPQVSIRIKEKIKKAELTVNLFYSVSLLEEAIGYRMRFIGLQTLQVESEHLYLRKVIQQDYDAIFDMQSREEVALSDGYAPITDPVLMEQKMIQMCMDPGTYSIVEKEHHQVIGYMGIHYAERCCAAFEVGYAIHPDFWNRGYATEIVRASVSACFQQLAADMVIACHFKDNVASKRVIEKLQMKYEGCIRKAFYHEVDGPVDLCSYSILKQEWEQLYK